jgi:hypothetical protein
MAEQIAIQWSINVQVAQGPKVVLAGDMKVDAYDKIEVLIPDGSSDIDVDIQPGGANKVQFMLISSDHYGTALTYQVNATGDIIALDKAQMFTGDGNVSLLGAPPSSLRFDNSLGKDATVEILVGRKAV